jgi:Xaa-Pro aminopeptidase
MAFDPKETLTLAPSDAELERRWKAVRDRMEADGVDVLVMQNRDQFLGGYVQWFTDYPARNSYPMTVIFPRNDEMTTITSGGTPPSDPGPAAWSMRGAKNRLSVAYFPSLHYTASYDAELAAKSLTPWRNGTIGLVNTLQMSAAFHDHLRKSFPAAHFVDATDLVDRIKAIKSKEEIGFLMQTVALQDAAMEYAKTVIRPGRRDFEIVADVIRKVTELGSEEQLVLAASAPFGVPAALRSRHFQNRMVREGDQFSLLVEVNGPGGIYGESGRCFFVGDVPAELYDANELVKEAQRHTAEMLKPGADPKEIWDANNEFLVGKGRLPETRLYAHGQGYDLVERPAIRDDEPMKLQPNMNITVHPTVVSGGLWVALWDNFLVTKTGVSKRLHKTPQEIFSV